MKTRPPTKAENEWLDRICQLGCIVCLNNGFMDSPAAPHHIDGHMKKGCHFKTIPLCGLHHQVGGYGLAFHAGRVIWETKNGSQHELLRQVQTMLLRNRDKLCEE